MTSCTILLSNKLLDTSKCQVISRRACISLSLALSLASRFSPALTLNLFNGRQQTRLHLAAAILSSLGLSR